MRHLTQTQLKYHRGLFVLQLVLYSTNNKFYQAELEFSKDPLETEKLVKVLLFRLSPIHSPFLLIYLAFFGFFYMKRSPLFCAPFDT